MGALKKFMGVAAVVGLSAVVYATVTAPPSVGPWTREADGPVRRFEAFSAVVGGDLYRFSGFVEELRATRAVYRYRRSTKTWDRLADAPTPVTHCNAVVDGQDIWIAAGFVGDNPGTATSSVWKYDTRTDRWTPQVDLPERRAGGALVRLGRSLHYFGGFDADRDTVHGDHFVLNLDDPTQWATRAPLPEPRGHLAGAAVHGLAYAIGGQLRHDTDPLDLPWVHAYDPRTDAWTQRASLPSGRSHDEQSVLVVDGKIVILGGRDTSKARNRFFRRRNRHLPIDHVTVYDSATDGWWEAMRLPVALLGPSAHVMGDEVVLLGGSINGPFEPQSSFYAMPLSALGLDE